MFKKSTESQYIQSFVRRNRISTQTKRNLIHDVLPQFQITPGNVEEFFLKYKEKKIYFELGFGNGEHLLKRAKNNPKDVFIGCEPYMNGVTQLLQGIEDDKVSNTVVYTGDARDILTKISNNCLDAIFVLFPDPWPKKKHFKRRIINNDSLNLFASKLVSGGRLLCATDHEDYATWILDHIKSNHHYNLNSGDIDEFKLSPSDWVETKYERKASYKSYYFDSFHI